jgi:hypothetical protein
LDYLALTDHHDDGRPEDSGVESVRDPNFGSHGVIGLPGYENSISGHAQMLGINWDSFTAGRYNAGNKQAADINRMADALRADGGVFQANHPVEAGEFGRPVTCDDAGTDPMDWGYGYDVDIESMEVWNIGHITQQPIPSMSSNEDAIRLWECWLQRRERVAATGGSDSHWISTAAIQGPGNPTTWVFARERSAAGVVQAIREGRTSISLTPPVAGATQLHLEADADGDGTFESLIGDAIPPGSAMRVRATGLPGGGFVQVRANRPQPDSKDPGRTLIDNAPLTPGGEVRFKAPDNTGWVRATLFLPEAKAERSACEPAFGSQTSYCRNSILITALTSPIYLAHPTQLTVTAPPSGHHTDNISVSATLKSSDVPLAGRPITFRLGAGEVTATTDSNGSASATITVDSDPGNTALTASFPGEPDYMKADATTPFEVLREVTVLKYTGDTSAKGETVRLAATLTEDDGPPLVRRTVTFDVEGTKFTASTDGQGLAETTVTIPNHGRSKSVAVSYLGETRFEPATANATVRWGAGLTGFFGNQAANVASAGGSLGFLSALLLLARWRRRRSESEHRFQ